MNESLIIGMVSPYVKNNELTYQEFEQIFNMLSLREQYAVLEILYTNHIELVEEYTSVGNKNCLPRDELENEKDSAFEILYDTSLFLDNGDESSENQEDNDKSNFESEYLRVRDNIHLSNRALVKMIQEGNAQAKQDLCIKNQRLVGKLVNVYQNVLGNKLDAADLEQVGMVGMIKAAEKFDLDKGTEFSTYAVAWIKQAITREINDNGYSIRIPVHKMEQIHKVIRYDSHYSFEADYYKRVNMISEATKLPGAIVEDCLRLFYQFIRTTSLDLPIGEEEDTLLGELIPDERIVSVEDETIQHALREKIEEALQVLSDKEQKVIRLRFGLDDDRERTLEEIGMEFGVTRERIRQIEAKALVKLRKSSMGRKCESFLE